MGAARGPRAIEAPAGRHVRAAVRFAGGLTGLLAGAFVAVVFGVQLLGRAEGFSVARAFVPLVLLTAFGLLYDVLRARYPELWRSAHPDRLWMSWLFKTALYWTVAFPLVRLVQDLGTAWEVAGRVPEGTPADLFPYLSSARGVVGFLLFQAVYGSAFGVVFTFLYRRVRGKG